MREHRMSFDSCDSLTALSISGVIKVLLSITIFFSLPVFFLESNIRLHQESLAKVTVCKVAVFSLLNFNETL